MKTDGAGSKSSSVDKSASSAGANQRTADTSSAGARRTELSTADKAVQEQIEAKKGPAALVDSAKVKLEQHATMTPSEYWGSKLGECYSKGISAADCTPWS